MTDIDTSAAATAALLDGVTEGPWTIPEKYISEVERADGKTISSCWYESCIGTTINLHDVADCSLEESAANARFIAAARQLVPALAAENAALTDRAEQAEARIAELEGALDGLYDAITAEDRRGDRALTIAGGTANLKWLLDAQDAARAALAGEAGE